MNWIEKVKYLKKLDEEGTYAGSGKYLVDINLNDNLWQTDELENLIKDYPYLPKTYIDFVKEFDNLGLSFVDFFGSSAENLLPLKDEIEYWSKIFSNEYFPFARDSDGSAFTVNKVGEVIRLQINATEDEKPIKIADSFEEFVGECLLGKRYHEFNGSEGYPIENNTFYLLLKLLNWA